MKKISILCTLLILLSLLPLYSENPVPASKIVSVKLYQNQARITRETTLHLKKGTNTVTVSGLPPLLYDWSVKGSLPKDYDGKIISLEVAQKALLKKRQKNVEVIEKKLEALRGRDDELVDDLKNISSQERFLTSIVEFTNQNISRELATRIPQIEVWDDTLGYVTRKRSEIFKKKRAIEKQREEIGKEIQKWEFELAQIAGYNYYNNYQTLNKAVLTNRGAMQTQQYGETTKDYGEKRRLLNSQEGKVDIEKQIVLTIYSPENISLPFSFSYVIPSTNWNMAYDIRANAESTSVLIGIYANIYQKTGEDWNNIELSLSTGLPVNAISPPLLQPWYLDIGYPAGSADSSISYKEKSGKKMAGVPKRAMEKDLYFEPEIKETGPYFEISLPLRQSIASTDKYQKKFIRDFPLRGAGAVRFFYEVVPSVANQGFLKVLTTNTTNLPWLSGTAQIFLENEFMGNVSIPYTPQGRAEEIILGIEPRILAKKELVKKFEDTAGMLGGNRRIQYKYKVTVENQMSDAKEILIYDQIPVSMNKKISIEIENLSLAYFKDPEFEKGVRYEQGIRKWLVTIRPHQKIEISYDIVITFDKEITIRGLK